MLLETAEAEPGTLYEPIAPNLPLGLPFVPTAVSEGWFDWPALPDLFPVSFPGVKTSRDAWPSRRPNRRNPSLINPSCKRMVLFLRSLAGPIDASLHCCCKVGPAGDAHDGVCQAIVLSHSMELPRTNRLNHAAKKPLLLPDYCPMSVHAIVPMTPSQSSKLRRRRWPCAERQGQRQSRPSARCWTSISIRFPAVPHSRRHRIWRRIHLQRRQLE